MDESFGEGLVNPKPPVLVTFDYRTLRLLVGCIALSIPIVVSLLAKSELTSISASYYTDARDGFVGLLFVVGAFLWAYNGHTKNQKIASKFAAVAAIGVAVFPTTCASCESSTSSILHYGSAAVLFAILATFCFVFFRTSIKEQPGKKHTRSQIYVVCGVVMVLAMLVLGSTQFIDYTLKTVVFWAEAAALVAFGVAWIVAGKALPWLVDEDERLTFGD